MGQNASPIPQVLLGLHPAPLQDFLNPAHYHPARAKVTRGTKRLMLPLQTSLSGASGPRRKFQHCPLSAASFVWHRKEGRKVTFRCEPTWARLSCCRAAPCRCFRPFLLPCPSLISNRLNPPFGAQGRSRRLNEAYILQARNVWRTQN